MFSLRTPTISRFTLKVLSLACVLITSANAVLSQVTNVEAGFWSDATTWGNHPIPTCSDSVYLSYDIYLDAGAVCRALTTNGYNVTVGFGAPFYIMNCPEDIDGNTYNTTMICNQLLSTENLDVAHYRNGDTIPQITDSAQWVNTTSGAWCYYNNDPANNAVYGKLYNWYAVTDPRGLVPAGWHVPSETEWTEMLNCLGGSFPAGGPLKEAGLAHWASPNTGATNSSGFTGLPGGHRSAGFGPGFAAMTEFGYWWSSTNAGFGNALYLSLYYLESYSNIGGSAERFGFSVRFIRD